MNVRGRRRETRRWPYVLFGVVPLIVVLIVTLESRAPRRSTSRQEATSPASAGVHQSPSLESPKGLPGYASCEPGVESECVPVEITLAKYGVLVGEKVLKPEDHGLPACNPSLDPGFSSAEEAAKAVKGHEDDPATCAVDPEFIITTVWLTQSDATAFWERNGCGPEEVCK